MTKFDDGKRTINFTANSDVSSRLQLNTSRTCSCSFLCHNDCFITCLYSHRGEHYCNFVLDCSRYQSIFVTRWQADLDDQLFQNLLQGIVFVINAVILWLRSVPFLRRLLTKRRRGAGTNTREDKQTIEERKNNHLSAQVVTPSAASVPTSSVPTKYYILDQCQMCDEQNPWLIKCRAGCGRRGCHIFCVGICVHCGSHRCFDCWTINHCCEAAGQGTILACDDLAPTTIEDMETLSVRYEDGCQASDHFLMTTMVRSNGFSYSQNLSKGVAASRTNGDDIFPRFTDSKLFDFCMTR